MTSIVVHIITLFNFFFYICVCICLLKHVMKQLTLIFFQFKTLKPYLKLFLIYFSFFLETQDDDDDYGNGRTRLGGPLSMDNDSDDNLEDDEPTMMRTPSNNLPLPTSRSNNNNNNNTAIYYSNQQNSSKKDPFKMEVVDF